MLDPSLRATLEQRLGEVQFARTLEASPTQTIKPSASSSKSQPGSQLPLISLLTGDEGVGPTADTDAPDLEVRSVLGEGGMGKVQLAFQHSLGREVAIKTTRDGASPSATAALVREAVITGAIEHPGVVPVHALGLDRSGAPVLVMKRIEGAEWGALVESPDHPAWQAHPGDRVVTHLEILMQVCRTVHFAHKRGVLHLDIKPENVMVGDFGEVYLVDWGIARRFDPSSEAPVPHPALAGTPAYMAPEMVAGDGVDARTDVFLLGATLHSVLTGDVRNRGSNVAEVLAAALTVQPHDYGPSIPAELAEICNRATARDPARRFASADELRRAVAEHLQHKSSIALAEQAAERSEALAQLLASTPEHEPPAELHRAYQLATEARFGFQQALREWPKNPVALEQRAQCLTRVVELELRQGHVEAAETVMRELETVPPELGARLERARAKQNEQAAERARFRALAHDLDSTVASRQRAYGLAGLGVAGTVLALSMALGNRTLTPVAVLFVALSFLTVAGVFTFAFRRKLLENAFNRKAITLFLSALGAVALSRAVGLLEHATIHAIMLRDLFVIGVGSAAAGITLVRGMLLMAALNAVSVAFCLVDPERSVLVFAINVAVLPWVAFIAFRRHRSTPS